MKLAHLIPFVLPISILAADVPDIENALSVAADAEGARYVGARDAVTRLGSNALPMLASIAVKPGEDWRQRLLARIWYERIAKGRDVEALLNHDWRSYPPYRGIPEPGQVFLPVTGPASVMRRYVVPRCQETGLWYYYVELTWKMTEECPKLQPRRDGEFESAWPRWCRLALAGQPEEVYLFLAMTDRIAKDERLESPDAVVLYRSVCDAKDANAVEVLVDQFEAFFGREVTGPEMFPGRHAQLFRGMFEPILASADSRHSDLLDKFVAAHPALSELEPKLAEVRARPAPPPSVDPPFRLGTEAVHTP